MGDEEEAESALFSLLQRLRVAGAEAGLGFDLCELALAVGAPTLESADAEAAAAKAAVPGGGDKAVVASADTPRPAVGKRDREAARQRARFVKALVLASLAADADEPGAQAARGADAPP